MAMPNKYYLVKLLKEDGRSFYQALTEKTKEANYKITAYDFENHVAFEANITPEILAEIKRASRCENFEDSADQAFTTSDETSFFEVDLTKNILIWKKGDNSLRIRLGSFPITEIDVVSGQKSIFERLDVQNTANNEKVNKLQERNSELSYQLREAQKLSQMFRKDKESLESELIGKFLEILHTKQDKINELQKELNKRAEKVTGPENPDVMVISSSDDDECPNPETSIDSQNFLSLS